MIARGGWGPTIRIRTGRLLGVVFLAALLAGEGPPPAWGLSLALPAGEAVSPLPRVHGQVVSTRSAYGSDGVLRTEVVLADEAGAETGRFEVPGGSDGGDYWVVDGVPVFLPGEIVDVALAPARTGWTVAAGEDAVVRVAPAADGRSGARFEDAPAPVAGVADSLVPHVESVEPGLSGASFDQETIVTVRGVGFGAVQGTARVTFQGLFERVDAPVVSWADDEIRCRIPAPGLLGVPQVLTGTVKVWTAEGGWSDGDPFVGGPRFRILYQWAGDAWRSGNLPVGVYLNPRDFPWGAATGPIIAASVERWNVPGSYARLFYRGLTNAEAGPHRENGPRSGDDRNTVRWRKTWAHNPAWLAVTWSRIDTLTFEREETDLEINGENFDWTLDVERNPSAWDLPSTLAHEFGHWLRLGHTQQIASVMLPFFGAGQLRRELSAADAFGASWIYPAYGTIEAPPSIGSGAGLELRLRARDREGRTLPALPASLVTVDVVPLAAGTVLPGPIDEALGIPPVASATAAAETDADGWTTLRVASLPDGTYRLEARVEGSLVRPAPLLTVGEAPPVAAPVAAFAGVSPLPLGGGVRGLVRFTLPQSAHVELVLFDVRGSRVRDVASGRFAAGANEVPLWTRAADGTRLRAGVYFLRLSAVAGAAFSPMTSRLVVLP